MTKRKEIDPFNIPDKPPNLEIKIDTLNPDGSVKLLITNQDNGMTTYKTYETMEKAQRLATFTACTLGVGVKGSDNLQQWLQERGFPGLGEENRAALDDSLREALASQERKDPIFTVVEDEE